MGLFDKLLSKKETNKNQQQEPQRQYSMRTKEDDQKILVYDIFEQGRVRHRNDEITKLMIARITKYSENDTIYFDYSDYIAFELPLGEQINKELMEDVMRIYDRESQQGENSYYLGRATKGSEGYQFGSKSDAVEKMVARTVEKELEERQRIYEERRKKLEERNKKYRAEISRSARENIEMRKREIEARKAHPFLQSQGVYPDGKTSVESYDGININTGDILRIRGVNKVGKDGSGTYLYSAYIYNTPNQTDVEFFDITPLAYPICFELPKRLEDIVKSGNPKEIQSVLKLLSDPKNFEDKERLSYIGEIGRDGQVHRNEESSSNAIRLKINEMQKKFALEVQKRKQAEQEQEK